MNQSIKIPIKNRIIRKKNILDLANYLEYLNESDNGKTSFRITFKDDREILSDNKEIFESRIFEEKEIYKISMTYIENAYKSRVEINILNYDLYNYSDIKVISDDEKWISNISYNIDEFLSYCDSQNKFNVIFKHNALIIVIVLLLSTIIGLSIALFLRKALNMNIEATLIPTMILSTIVLMRLFEKLEKAYPNVEIAIQDKNNMAKKKRSAFISIITIVIIPILVNILYDTIKILFNNIN